jgi:hypothetical protein
MLSLGMLALGFCDDGGQPGVVGGIPLPLLDGHDHFAGDLREAWARLASAAPFVFWILCHLECPDMHDPPQPNYQDILTQTARYDKNNPAYNQEMQRPESVPAAAVL